ncbi:DNA recombination protein RmuC, partial [Christiangramia aquimixticola]
QAVQKGLGEMQSLANGVGDLKRVLTNVKSRGVLGEYQLQAILENLLSPDQYLVNASVNGSRDRVEFAIKMPGQEEAVLLPIDSKFPQESYLRLVDAYEANDKTTIDFSRAELI